MAVILNALRALRGNPDVEVDLPAETENMLRRFATEHDELRDTVDLLRDAADRLVTEADRRALESVIRANTFLDGTDPAARTGRGVGAVPGTGPSARKR